MYKEWRRLMKEKNMKNPILNLQKEPKKKKDTKL